MSTTHRSELLRANLLEGATVMLGCASSPPVDSGESLAAAVHTACAALGAHVSDCELFSDGSTGLDEAALEQAVDRALSETGSIELLAVDGAGLFACAAGQATTPGEHEPTREREGARRAALGACLDASWNLTRAVANRAFLPRERGGRIVYLAPAPGADRSKIGQHADAARAGLENLARTLSIEWARHGITAVTIAPGTATAADEVAALTAYLASPAGAYFSGCLLDLRGPAGQ
jgi:NAD(P)-dependent dehydrogenase (short-subunit alcohol dehydrogenase family)